MDGLEFYRGKRVLLTGHTGFKGSWMCAALLLAGAHVTGFALAPPTEPSLFEILGLERKMDSRIGDIRNASALETVFRESNPEIVIHMAAQPLVRVGYADPAYTFSVNIMGTANVLECVRHTDSVRSVINVTTDKVYRNRNWEWGYRESDELGGRDPYACSKACSELITASYAQSFFQDGGPAISTMRAGNVIGGGDFAADRIIPDCFRAVVSRNDIFVRNPRSVRPYQHALEPIMAYLLVARQQAYAPSLAGAYNVGPNEDDAMETGRLAELFCAEWNARFPGAAHWTAKSDNGPREDQHLRLDCSRLKAAFSWHPVWTISEAMSRTVELYAEIFQKGNPQEVLEQQIRDYLSNVR